MLDVCPSSFLFLFPPRHQLVRHPEMIQNSGHDGVHDLLDILRAIVERGVGREDCCASQEEFLRQRHQVDYDQRIRKWAAEVGASAGFSQAEGFRQHLAPPFPNNNVLVELLSARLIPDPLKRSAVSQE